MELFVGSFTRDHAGPGANVDTSADADADARVDATGC
jgi:hypothetical protein